MRDFHELVFDDQCGPSTFYLPAWPWLLLGGSVDSMKVVVSADSVLGADTIFNLAFLEGADLQFIDTTTFPLAGVPLSPSQNTVLSCAYTPADGPPLHFAGVIFAIDGTDPRAHIRIWITGRRN